MNFRRTILELAFELADSGEYARVADIKRKLQTQGFGPNQIRQELYGPQLAADLRKRCERAVAKNNVGVPA